MKYLRTLAIILVFAGIASAAETVIGNPAANPQSIVVSGSARFTILAPELIRLEYSTNYAFEDRASFTFINRNLPAPPYEISHSNGWLIIYTEKLTLKYRENSGIFNSENLFIESAPFAHPYFLWHPGKPDTANLGGTIRTLDQVSGWTEIGDGLLSKGGWVLLDDSANLLFDGTELNWPSSRIPGHTDWYFLGYGHNYKKALYDYAQIAGKIPLPPKWVFGAWWSRYWNYTDEEFKQIVRDFGENDVPLDVLVVDMDWHLEGWTGYTWNPQYFPDPVGFLEWCHGQNLHVPLNLHPHQGVGRHEAAFPAFARFMNLDPDSVDRIPFAPADPQFMEAYFKILHHPLEKQGVDFWWIDWQQGNITQIPGLDPLFWLNHLHWTDMLNNPARKSRPLFFSRWGGPGGHRYQIGFSGDTHSVWKSLDFQPYFTASAGNVCYPYWSHDIGGHYFGQVEPELYARWIQWGALNPILRTHSTKNPQAERRIWAFPPEIFSAAKAAFKLRYSLIPYIYTAARQCYDTALPLVRPLYLEYPDLEEAYHHSGEYLFGDQILAAPVTTPVDPYSKTAVSTVWFPPGKWYHWFTGQQFSGPAEYNLNTPLSQIPFFVKEGGIIPQMFKTVDGQLTDASRIGTDAYDTIVLNIFPGDKGEYVLYEDDGDSRGYETGQFATTKIAMSRKNSIVNITIFPTEGDYANAPESRPWRIRLHNVRNPQKVLVDGKKIDMNHPSGNCRLRSNPYEIYAEIILDNKDSRDTANIKIELNDKYEKEINEGLKGKISFLDELDRLYEKDTGTPRRWKEFIPASEKNALLYIIENWERLCYSCCDEKVSDDFKTMLLMRMSGISLDFNLADKDNNRLTYICKVNHHGWSHSRPSTSNNENCGSRGNDNSILRINRHGRLESRPSTSNNENGGSRGNDNSILRINTSNPETNITADIKIAAPPDWTLVSYTDNSVVKPNPSCQAVFLLPQDCQNAVIEARAVLQLDSIAAKITLRKEILPSINSWYLLGPFDNPWQNSLETVHPPEKSLDLQASYSGKNGQEIRWQKSVRDLSVNTDLSSEFFLDLIDIFNDTLNCAAVYGLTYIDADSYMPAQLAVGSDDGLVIWLNGEEIHRNDIGRGYAPKQDLVPISLRPGRNTLLIKVVQGWGGWGFSVFLQDTNGETLTGVKTGIQ